MDQDETHIYKEGATLAKALNSKHLILFIGPVFGVISCLNACIIMYHIKGRRWAYNNGDFGEGVNILTISNKFWNGYKHDK